MGARPTGPGTAFANFLIDYLPVMGISNVEVMEALGYSRPNIVSMWKTAQTRVTLDQVWPLSKLLNVDPAFMLALYFEQFSGDGMKGLNNYEDILRMVCRITTPEEWDIILAVREARNFNSVPLKNDQKKELKKMFSLPADTAKGPYEPIDITLPARTIRTGFMKRGHARDMTVTEIEDAASKKAGAEKGGKVIAAGSRAKAKS